MKLAVNYSSQAAGLLEQGRIELDLFKCPDWPWMIAEARRLRPVAVHFTLTAGNGNLDKADWSLVERLKEETGTPYVNLHLDPSVKHFPGIPPDAPEPWQSEQIIERLRADLDLVVRRFGPEKVIAENVPYRGPDGKAMRPAVEPEVITHLLEETGAGLLLDISHARIAARVLGRDEHDYMQALPVHRLKELHFTGLHQLDDRLQDHLSILETDWPALDWVFERIRLGEWAEPWLLAFEYGGVGEKFAWRSDPAVMEEQIPQLYRRVHHPAGARPI